jgi:hypothetical protein
LAAEDADLFQRAVESAPRAKETTISSKFAIERYPWAAINKSAPDASGNHTDHLCRCAGHRSLLAGRNIGYLKGLNA